MGEVEAEAGVLREEPARLNTEVGVNLPTEKGRDPISMAAETKKENIGSGMKARQEVPAPEEVTRKNLGKGTRNTWR